MKKIPNYNIPASFVNPQETYYHALPDKPPELLECPCCGGQAVFKSLHAYWIECTCCGLATPAYNDIDIAARAWNGGIQAVVTIKKSGDEPDTKPVSIDGDRNDHPRDSEFNGLMDETELFDAMRIKALRDAGIEDLNLDNYEFSQPQRKRVRLNQ